MPELYNFQKEAISKLYGGKYAHIVILPTGSGKTAVMFKWLEMAARKHKRVLIVTTASKSKSGDMETEADMWNGEGWRKSLTKFTVISWHKLRKWYASTNRSEISKYCVCFDEIQRAKGYMTGMGLAARNIVGVCEKWAGFTATPGDKWIDLMPYLVMCGFVKNKTQFLNDYCDVCNYKGFPEITGYHHTEVLKKMWDIATVRPDASQMFRELPSETHKVVYFKCPADYNKLKNERIDDNGDPIDTVPGLVHALRQKCFTAEKKQWVADFISGLGTNAVLFCNYIEEEECLEAIARRNLPKDARVWRIDGKHHDIPKPDTIGPYDIVIAHYLSGSEALNLQFIHYWVSVSPNYSYSVSVQARGRIKRIGQKHPMKYYYLWTQNTIEDDIMRCLRQKSDFSEDTWCAKNLIN